MLSAKLLVAAGAPLQLRAGERLSPLQPKPLNTCSLAMVAPSLISGLVRVRLCAQAAPAPKALNPSAAVQTLSFLITIFLALLMAIAPSVNPDLCLGPGDSSHSNFRDGVKAREAIGEGRAKPSRIPGRKP